VGTPSERPPSYVLSAPDARTSRNLPLGPAKRCQPIVTGTVEVIESCIPALRRYAGALLRDRQDVDDLVHDCLVRALDRLHTRRDDGEMRPWLFAIMHNLYVSRVRRRQTRGEAESLDVVDEASIGVGARQESHVQTREVMAAVRRLPEDLRGVLLLITVEDLSYAETARVLNIPIGTVMSRLSRARERIRREL
jgi:RNA polymerase sigma-70 factor, ECF subfamily